VHLRETTWDVSARVAAERAVAENEWRYRMVVEHSPIGMALVSPDDRWIEVNPVLCGILGRSVEELCGHTTRDVIHPDDEAVSSEARRRLLAGEVSSLETEERYLRPDGEVVSVSLTVGLRRDEAGAPLYLFGQFQDLTERTAQWAALERERDDALRSNRELERFASVASHDLSEPLRTIAGLVDLLAQDYGERLDAAADEYLGFVVAATCRMRAMIDGLLAYSRIGPLEMRIVPVDVALVLEEVRQELGCRFGETCGTLAVVDALPTLRADPVTMHQLLLNLVANALKFRHPDRSPWIEVGAADGGTHWALTVSDNGIGIAAPERAQVFQMFHRLHRSGAFDGSGIGLATCRKIAESHGGSIELTDSRLGGVTAVVSLPKEHRRSEWES